MWRQQQARRTLNTLYELAATILKVRETIIVLYELKRLIKFVKGIKSLEPKEAKAAFL